MRKVSELNDQQRKLFTFVSAIPPEKRKSHNGGQVAEDTAIWNEGMNINFELLTSAG